MAVSRKGKRKIVVQKETFYWRIDKKNGLDDLEVIHPQTKKAYRYGPLSRVRGDNWDDSIFELALLGAEVYPHEEGDGENKTIVERVCVRPALVREVILSRYFGQRRNNKDRIREAIDRSKLKKAA